MKTSNLKQKGAKIRRFPLSQMKRKMCRFCAERATVIDYKDVRKLEKLVSERGKILPVRITGTCAKHQRMLRRAINRARFLALLPHVKS